jgi:ubiquinone/menaquinone biosynthesis C-methylase UbiE
MLDMAAERLSAHSNVDHALCEGTRVPAIADATVDFAYSILVLQHLEKEDAFLLAEEVVRMLRPGGRALFTWPNVLDDFFLNTFLAYAHGGEVTNPIRVRIRLALVLDRFQQPPRHHRL